MKYRTLAINKTYINQRGVSDPERKKLFHVFVDSESDCKMRATALVIIAKNKYGTISDFVFLTITPPQC